MEQKCETTTMNQEIAQQITPQATEENMEHHPTNDEIEEYEESQRKFRELWEKKREKVSLHSSHPFPFLLLYCKFTNDEFSGRRQRFIYPLIYTTTLR